MRRSALVLLGLAVQLATLPALTVGEFPLKDGDIWVMAGDSITAQKLHSNYFEAFCYARYPNLTFRFRNSGVGGDTLTSAMKRFDYDAAAWKPSIVSVVGGASGEAAGIFDDDPMCMQTVVRVSSHTANIGSQ